MTLVYPTLNEDMSSVKPVPNLRNWVQASSPQMKDARYLKWDESFNHEYGAEVRVALLDSGLLWTHPMFKGAQIKGKDFTGSCSLNDRTGHGTKNASILIGQDQGWIKGLCPESELIFAKVLGVQNRESSIKSVAQGIRWAVGKRADIIVLPFGMRKGATLVIREIRRAIHKGCEIIAAAGNRGPDEYHFPAWLPQVKAVTGIKPDGKLVEFCCARDEIDFYAPGESVPAVGTEGYTEFSGSSPAAVIAAGIAALKIGVIRRRENVKESFLK